MDCPYCKEQLISDNIVKDIPMFDFNDARFYTELAQLVTCKKCKTPIIFTHTTYDIIFDTVWLGETIVDVPDKKKSVTEDLEDIDEPDSESEEQDVKPKKRTAKKLTKTVKPKKKESSFNLAKFV